MGVFANGLEISGKAVQAQTIAAFPDVCFTPPQTPATPPGVPIPYPSFGMASDTANGTSTVKIGGKTVNIKNKSNLSKTSGTEAGAAPKKGIITSKNTGKEQFNSWSNDVKFDGEPVIRMSDLATNNHASPAGNTPPWVHVAKLNLANVDCSSILQELKIHEHASSPCASKSTGKESEHTIRAATLQKKRGKLTCDKHWSGYEDGKAPCICMQARHMKNGKPKKGEGSKRGTDHDLKTKKVNDYLDSCRGSCRPTSNRLSCGMKCKVPSMQEVLKVSVEATCEHDDRISQSEKKYEEALECLTVVNLVYLAQVDDTDDKASAEKKMEQAKKKPICAKGVCKAKKKAPCRGC
jgi:hypothetical protein